MDAQVVAYHVPQEMQRLELPPRGVMQDHEVETGFSKNLPRNDSSQGHTWSPSRGELGVQARAQEANFGVGAAAQPDGSGENSSLPDLQYPQPSRTSV